MSRSGAPIAVSSGSRAESNFSIQFFPLNVALSELERGTPLIVHRARHARLTVTHNAGKERQSHGSSSLVDSGVDEIGHFPTEKLPRSQIKCILALPLPQKGSSDTVRCSTSSAVPGIQRKINVISARCLTPKQVLLKSSFFNGSRCRLAMTHPQPLRWSWKDSWASGVSSAPGPDALRGRLNNCPRFPDSGRQSKGYWDLARTRC